MSLHPKELAQGLGPGLYNAKCSASQVKVWWPEGTPGKPTARKSPPLHSLLKNSRGSWFYLPSCCLLPCRCWSVAGRSRLPSYPHHAGAAGKRSHRILKWKIPHVCRFPKAHTLLHTCFALRFWKRPAEPAWRPRLSSVLPPLCSSRSLTKSVWTFLWGYLSISILGSPRIPIPVTRFNNFFNSFRN